MALRNAVTLPEALQEKAEKLAGASGTPLDHWIAEAVEQRIAHEETRRFFQERAARGSLADLKAILDRVPSNPPDPGDELPEGWTRKD